MLFIPVKAIINKTEIYLKKLYKHLLRQIFEVKGVLLYREKVLNLFI